MEVVFDRGVYLPTLDLWLDSLRKRDLGLISHAHSDHTARHRRPVLTPNTRILLADYLKKSDPVTLEYHEPLETDKFTLTLYPAGHCLGSSQALVESKTTGERLLYTGDFKSRPSPVNEALEPVSCDTLVIEATYGRPEYTFPDETQVLETAFRTLRSWLSQGHRPVVQGWRLGKAQEVLHHLLAAGFDLVVEESAYQVAEAYQVAGVQFPGQFRPFDGTWSEGQILICPPGKSSSEALKNIRSPRVMELTGWASNGRRRWGRRGDASLPYSDHADFNDLVSYVKRVQPREVYTVNGFRDLAAYLRNLGYPAVHLDGKSEQQGPGFQMKLV
ncbi:MAG: MBL fold metallo-hydrolase RNA specificity domain-containing protein [Dehalococcoidia bacterium]